jgi:hypothetical protein
LKRREENFTSIGRSLLHFPERSQMLLAFLIQRRNRMTKLNLLSAALIAAAMLATPAMARENHVNAQRHATTTTGERDIDGSLCTPAPAVGAFATQPWDNGPPCEPVAAN